MRYVSFSLVCHIIRITWASRRSAPLVESWTGLAGLIVAILGIVLTVGLRLYDYRKQRSQRRIDRIGNANFSLFWRLQRLPVKKSKQTYPIRWWNKSPRTKMSTSKRQEGLLQAHILRSEIGDSKLLDLL